MKEQAVRELIFHMAFVFQFYDLVPTLTALENAQVAIEIVSDAIVARPEASMTDGMMVKVTE